eukprot:COSAG01_NODE_1531_length_10004_cov_5.769006_4_plen_76_part_00
MGGGTGIDAIRCLQVEAAAVLSMSSVAISGATSSSASISIISVGGALGDVAGGDSHPAAAKDASQVPENASSVGV